MVNEDMRLESKLSVALLIHVVGGHGLKVTLEKRNKSGANPRLEGFSN